MLKCLTLKHVCNYIIVLRIIFVHLVTKSLCNLQPNLLDQTEMSGPVTFNSTSHEGYKENNWICSALYSLHKL